jgi:hypothetical protein
MSQIPNTGFELRDEGCTQVTITVMPLNLAAGKNFKTQKFLFFELYFIRYFMSFYLKVRRGRVCPAPASLPPSLASLGSSAPASEPPARAQPLLRSVPSNQGFGSGSVLDPDSIRSVDPYSESGSGQRTQERKKLPTKIEKNEEC